MAKFYGKIKGEEAVEQSIIAREIVKTIGDYGVTQYQILKIIYLLSLELEDRQLSDDLITIVKSVLEPLDGNKETVEDSKIITR